VRYKLLATFPIPAENQSVRSSPFEAYAAAVAAERAAWDAVKARMPRTKEFDPQLWTAFREASRQADDARRELMAVIARRPFSI
jgi:hypothetical protein